MAMRRLGLAVKHALPVLFVTVLIAWLLDYLGLSPFLTGLLTGFAAVFQYGLDKYRQLPPDPRPPERRGASAAPAPRRTESGAPAPAKRRRPFQFRRVFWGLIIILVVFVSLYIYWIVSL